MWSSEARRLRRVPPLVVAAALLASPAVAAPFDDAVDAAKTSMMGSPGEALRHAQSALSLAARDPVKVATAQWLEGEALIRLDRPKEARALIEAALPAVAQRQPNSNLHGRLTMARANLADAMGETAAALDAYQQAFRIFGAAGEPRGQAMALLGVGDVYEEAGDHVRALDYYAHAGEAYKADPALLLAAHNNTANTLKALGRYPQAIAEYQKALSVARAMESPLMMVRVLENMAAAEVLAGRLAAADAHIAQGLGLAASDPDAREWRTYLWGVSAEAAAKRGDLAEARRQLDRTFAGVDLAATELQFRDLHQLAASVYERVGERDLALAHLKAFKRIDDAARAVTTSAEAALAAARFDYANQQSRIARLKAAQLQKDVELARARGNVVLVLLGGAVLLAGVLLAAFLSVRNNRNALRQAHARLSDANLSLERAVRARTEFLATTSHEIRTPLNAILGMTQVLLADRSLSAPMREKVSIVHGAGETMRALMDDILDAAKIETGNLIIERVEIDLPGLLEEARRLWNEPASGKGVALTVDFAEAPARIVEDVTRLRQILFNLMSNAIKFTKDGAVDLSVTVEPRDGGEVLAFQVSDTGIGIPEDRLEDIFESFRQVDGSVTRKYGGTGLGLAICRRLATAMGGELTVASTLGEGSTFTVRLPLRRAAAPAPPPPQAAHVPAEALGASALLAVDPNPLAQSLLRAALTDQVRGLEVVGSWPEALGAMTGQAFDLVLVDGGALTDGAGEGMAMMPSLVREARGAPIVVMWGGSGEEAERLLAGGAAHVVRKPISTAELVGELREVCEAAAPTAAAGAARQSVG